MDDGGRLERIGALWAGDAVQDVTLLWRSIRKLTDDPERIVKLIAAAGDDDPGVEVEAETLAAMQRLAREETAADPDD